MSEIWNIIFAFLPYPYHNGFMIYVALLRGINVGGKNPINMKELKSSFENCGMESVTTYINSGNIIFSHGGNPHDIVEELERRIHHDFGLSIKVLLRSKNQYAQLMEAIPESWTNDGEQKSNILFLWDSIDKPEIVNQLTIKPDIDDVRYVPGALLWNLLQNMTTKSGLMRLASSPIYKKMTVRNVNTVRKIYRIMEET